MIDNRHTIPVTHCARCGNELTFAEYRQQHSYCTPCQKALDDYAYQRTQGAKQLSVSQSKGDPMSKRERTCQFCQSTSHYTAESCPRVAAIEYSTTKRRRIKRVEFVVPTAGVFAGVQAEAR